MNRRSFLRGIATAVLATSARFYPATTHYDWSECVTDIGAPRATFQEFVGEIIRVVWRDCQP